MKMRVSSTDASFKYQVKRKPESTTNIPKDIRTLHDGRVKIQVSTIECRGASEVHGPPLRRKDEPCEGKHAVYQDDTQHEPLSTPHGAMKVLRKPCSRDAE